MMFRRSIRPLAAVLLLTFVAATGCKKQADDTSEAKPVVSVEAEKAAVGDITESVESDAVLAPVAQAAIVPKISAPVKRFVVQRGARVRSGQLLAVLENADLAGAVTDTQGALTQAQATYRSTTGAQVPEDRQKAESDVRQAESALQVQKAITASRSDLLAQGAIPRRDFETAQAALVQAQSTYDVAQRHLSALQAVSQHAVIENAAGALTSAKGKAEQATAGLSYSMIRSPINGFITDRPLFAGEMAQAGSPLLTVMDTSSLVAKIHLALADAVAMRLGDKASLAIAGTDITADGVISLISPAYDSGSSTLEVWAKFPNRGSKLKPGMPAHIKIATHTLEHVTTIPAESIITSKTGGSAVLVIGDDSIAHQRPVEVGASDGKDTQVISGVKPGEMIVTTGAHSLEDGTKVKVGAPDDEKAGGGEAKSSEADDAAAPADEKSKSAKPSAGKSAADKSGSDDTGSSKSGASKSGGEATGAPGK